MSNRSRSRSRSRSISRSRSRDRNRSTKNTRLPLSEILGSNGNPLSGEKLWAARINKWVDSDLLNLEDNNYYLTKIDLDTFKNNRHKDFILLKTNTIMIVKKGNIVGFGIFSTFDHSNTAIRFQPYIEFSELKNYEHYLTTTITLKDAGTYEFYILKTPGRGGAIMRKSKKSRKSRKARKSRKM